MSPAVTTIVMLWWGGLCFGLGVGGCYALYWLLGCRAEVPPSPTASSEIARIGRQTDAAIIRAAMRYREAERMQKDRS